MSQCVVLNLVVFYLLLVESVQKKKKIEVFNMDKKCSYMRLLGWLFYLLCLLALVTASKSRFIGNIVFQPHRSKTIVY